MDEDLLSKISWNDIRNYQTSRSTAVEHLRASMANARANKPAKPSSMLTDMYIKIRSDNIALSHEAAIEIVKMIRQDADRLTAKDFE